jgi:hypothetical protein
MDVTLILVTLLSLALAAVMTLLAWRLAREERRRSEARVAALSAEIHASERDLPLHGLRAGAPVATSHELFEAPAGRATAASRVAAALVGAASLIACAGIVWYLAGAARSATPARAQAPSNVPAAAPAKNSAPATNAANNPAPATNAPLELTALTHERDGDRLTVRGVVRNPAGGAGLHGLAAVVFVFDRNGDFVTSGRAAIDSLAASSESPFGVTIPNVGDVGRYRVSFRTEDRIVPHVDRRNRQVAEVKQR